MTQNLLNRNVLDIVLPNAQNQQEAALRLGLLGVGTALFALSFYGTDIQYYEYRYQPTPYEVMSHIQKHKDEAYRLQMEYNKRLRDWKNAQKLGWNLPKPEKPEYKLPTPEEVIGKLQNDPSNYYLVPTWHVDDGNLPSNPEYRQGKLPKLPLEVALKNGFGEPYLKTVNDAPYNPYKGLLAWSATALYATAAAMSNQRCRELGIAIPIFRTKIYEFWAKGLIQQRLNLQAYVDYARTQAAVNAGREYAAALESGDITEVEYIEIQASAQRQAELLYQQQAALPGQSLDDVTTPKDKVEATKTAKQKLLQLIHDHEGGWIEILIGGKGIHLTGAQGASKTTFAAFLALAAFVIHGRRPVSIADPHYHQNGDDPLKWKYFKKLLTVAYGANGDYAEIARAVSDWEDRLNTRTEKDKPTMSIFDELTNYSEYEESKAAAKALARRRISDPRKANDVTMTIGHGTTIALTGNADGTSDSMLDNVLIVKLNADNSQRPLYKGKILGLKDDEGEFLPEQRITLNPKWMNPDFVWQLVQQEMADKKKAASNNQPADEMEDPPPELWQRAVEFLNGLLYKDATPTQPTQAAPQLSEVAGKVLEYFHNVRTKTPKTLRDLKKSGRLAGYSDQQLTDALKELVEQNRLSFDGLNSYSLPEWNG